MKFLFRSTCALLLLFSAESLSAQTPQYVETDTVVVSSPSVRLPAVVTLPADTAKPFPVCILLGGSGPTDKDGTLGPTKFLRDLARELAARGVASIRYDKRTAVYGARTAEVSGFHINYDTEVCEDALVAVDLAARMFPENNGSVWIVGHSLGGMLAPRVAALGKGRVGGIVALAAPARKLLQTLSDQIDYLAKQQGLTPDQKEAVMQQLKGGLPQEYMDFDETYDAVATAKGLNIPMLFLQGENDYQVTSGDAFRWQISLAVKPNASIRLMPRLNHLFAPSEQMATPTDYMVREQKISPEIVGFIAEFIISNKK